MMLRLLHHMCLPQKPRVRAPLLAANRTEREKEVVLGIGMGLVLLASQNVEPRGPHHPALIGGALGQGELLHLYCIK